MPTEDFRILHHFRALPCLIMTPASTPTANSERRMHDLYLSMEMRTQSTAFGLDHCPIFEDALNEKN